MTSQRPEPADIEVDRDEAVTIHWRDGHVSRYRLEPLRRACTCATCRNERDRGREVWPRPGAPERLAIVDARLTGAWGLSITWNDGHSTGIYAWDVLRAWCPCDECREPR